MGECYSPIQLMIYKKYNCLYDVRINPCVYPKKIEQKIIQKPGNVTQYSRIPLWILEFGGYQLIGKTWKMLEISWKKLEMYWKSVEMTKKKLEFPDKSLDTKYVEYNA